MPTPKISNKVRREQVTGATLKIISERGLGGLTTAALANEVGMSEANLYRHFANKEEILSETVERIGEGLRQNLEKVFQMTDPPLARLKKIFMLHLDFIEKNNGIPRLVFSEELHGGNVELKTKMLNIINSYSSRLEAIIKEGQKAGSVRQDIDPSASALTIIGMVQVTILRWLLSGFSFSPSSEGKKLWKNFEICITKK
jgi:TetR/AcrR family transcriptional regulator, fatty acid metabolism regulator protein